MHRLVVNGLVWLSIANGAAAGDLYLTPKGAGKKDGSSFADALEAEGGGLQRAWDRLASGEACRLGSGAYRGVQLAIVRGGTDEKPKRLIGSDTGAGLPAFEGNWVKDRPAEGLDFVRVRKGASHCAFENLTVRRYRHGLWCEGNNAGIRITGWRIREGREGIILDGGVDLARPEAASHDIVVTDCEIAQYTKRGVRIRNGVYNAQFIRCTADGGGPEYGTEAFPVGFAVAEKKTGPNAPPPKEPVLQRVNGVTIPIDREHPYDHDITFIDCVAKNHYFDAGKDGYWQGDGFGGESNAYNIRYIRCKAFDNTDGGWDTKALNVRLEDCIAMRNKRNYRFWASRGDGSTLLRCLGAYARFPGGSGEAVGLWCKGRVQVAESTFYNNGTQVILNSASAQMELVRCIVAADAPKNRLTEISEGAQLVKTESVEWLKGGAGEDPQLLSPLAEWDGEGENFNSRRYGTTKGFRKAPLER